MIPCGGVSLGSVSASAAFFERLAAGPFCVRASATCVATVVVPDRRADDQLESRLSSAVFVAGDPRSSLLFLCM